MAEFQHDETHQNHATEEQNVIDQTTLHPPPRTSNDECGISGKFCIVKMENVNSSRVANSQSRRQSFPSPHTHYVLGFELVPKLACENADLTSMMRIMLNEVGQHVDRAARHAFHSGLMSQKSCLEQPCEILCRLM